jgi:cation transporter-like permease
LSKHIQTQLARAARLFAAAVVVSVVTGAVVAAVEVTWRQLHPALPVLPPPKPATPPAPPGAS